MAKSKIVLPKVSEYFADRTAGDRVDSVLTTLSSELQSLKSADTASVAGVPAASVGSTGIFFQTFETPVVTWTKRTDSGVVTYPANGQAGGKAFRSAGGESFYEFPENIPFNDDRLYRIRARFRMVTAPGNPAKDLVSVGVQGFAADGTTLVDRNGTTTATDFHPYAAASVDMGGLTLNTWYTYTGYFQGWGTASATPSTDADAPRAMHSNVRYIRPCFRLNHDAGDGTMEIDYVSLEVLTEGSESNQTLKDVVNLGTGKVATNKVVEGSITAGSISTGKLQTLTGGGLTINMAATGTQKVLDHAGFWVKADGTADFSGNVSAAIFSASTARFYGTLRIGGAGAAYAQLTATGAGFYDSAGTNARIFASYVSGKITYGGGSGHSSTQFVNVDTGFFGATPVAQQTDPGAITDSTGGTPSSTISAVSGTGDDSGINNALASLISKVNDLRTASVNLGLTG
jgi:hypothetical protein